MTHITDTPSTAAKYNKATTASSDSSVTSEAILFKQKTEDESSQRPGGAHIYIGGGFAAISCTCACWRSWYSLRVASCLRMPSWAAAASDDAIWLFQPSGFAA